MTILFTTVGSAADYGSFGRWFLLVITCISWASMFATLSLTCTCSIILPHESTTESRNSSAPSRWPVAMALFTIGFICYGATLVFFAAVFPRLARNTSHCRKMRDRYEAGQITLEEYEIEESLEKNRISNISTVSTISYIWISTYSGRTIDP